MTAAARRAMTEAHPVPFVIDNDAAVQLIEEEQ